MNIDFIEKIESAMQLLQEGCRSNDKWENCRLCPFSEYCDAIEEAGFCLPDSEDFIKNQIKKN